jgi:hypothetical protein
MKKYFSLFCISILMISCNSFFNIEKRKYMKGYHVSKISNSKNKGKMHSTPENNVLLTNTETALLPLAESVYVTTAADVEQQYGIAVTKAAHEKARHSSKNNAPNKTTKKAISGSTPLVEANNKTKEKEISWGILALAGGLMGASFAGMYRSKRGGFMRIQAWSHKNKFKARAIVILTRIALTISGFAAGIKLFEAGHLLPQYSAFVFAAIYIGGILLYPFKKTKQERLFSMLRTKISGLMLSFSGFLLCMTLGNQVSFENANGINTERHINKRSTNYFESKKDLSGSVTQLIEDDPNDTASYILRSVLLFFAIASVIILQIALLAFSCILACEGAEGAAVALAFGGTVVLAALSIITIYWIKRINLTDQEKES